MFMDEWVRANLNPENHKWTLEEFMNYLYENNEKYNFSGSQYRIFESCKEVCVGTEDNDYTLAWAHTIRRLLRDEPIVLGDYSPDMFNESYDRGEYDSAKAAGKILLRECFHLFSDEAER